MKYQVWENDGEGGQELVALFEYRFDAEAFIKLMSDKHEKRGFFCQMVLDLAWD